MIPQKRLKWSSPAGFLLAAAVWMTAGCSQQEPMVVDPARVPNRLLGPMTIAVAPALNFSGSADFDRNAVADLMASELGHVDGITVIPVSRVLAVLARQGRSEVASPRHALEIREQLGADAVLVFAVIEYDPYEPPVVGLAAQLYGQVPGSGQEGGFDPVLVARQARPPVAPAREVSFPGLISEVQRTFDASHQYVVEQVKRFARRRGTRKGPYGWKLYLVSQQDYLRFCCSTILEALVNPPHARMATGDSPEEVGS